MPRTHRFDRTAVALALVTAALAILPARGGAQSLDGIALGARVRVEIPNVERPRPGHERVQSVAGTVDDVRGDTLALVVGPGATSLRLTRASIRRLYVSRGRPPRWQAALRGAVAPALLGAAVSAASMGIRRPNDGQSPGRVVASSAAWGAASGAAFGAWSQRERWRRVVLPPIASPAPVVADTRTGLSNDN